MSDYFVDDVEVNDEDEFVEPEQELVDLNAAHADTGKLAAFSTSPRKRLEQLMEEKRLRDELEDFLDL